MNTPKISKLISFILAVCLLVGCLPLSASAADIIEQENNNSFSAAQTITSNTFVNGNLASKDDFDFYRITISSPGYISLTFNHEYVDSGANQWSVTLYNGSNYELASYRFIGNSTKNDCNSIGVPAGNYYAKVERYSPNYSNVTYNLKINYTASNSWEKEFNNSFSAANTISANTSVNGSLMTNSDFDFFKVNISSAGYISLSFNHDYVDSSANHWSVTLYNGDFYELSSYTFTGNSTKNERNPIGVPAGSYYAKVERYSPNYSSVSYDLKINYTASNIWEKEFNDSVSTANIITLGSPATGTLMTRNDTDYYKVSVPSNQSVRFTFSHDYENSGANYYSVTLYDGDVKEIITYRYKGNVTEQTEDSMGVSPGTYYIKVIRYSPNYSSGKYTLSLNNGGIAPSPTPSPSPSPDPDDSNDGKNTEAAITSLKVGSYNAIISDQIITVKLPYGTDLKTQKVYITASEGAKLELLNSNQSLTTLSNASSGVTMDVSFVRWIRVTSEDGEKGVSYRLVAEVEEKSTINFSDVSKSAYYYDAVAWAVENNITSGTGNGKFSPNQGCTRAQAVTFLWRAAGSPTISGGTGFSDVPSNAYYANAVKWAVQRGITSGTGNGKFSPDAVCTRAQIVTFQYRAAGSPSVSSVSNFSDVSSTQYYFSAVRWAVSNNITSGTGNGKFSPNTTCTRGQIVTFLYRDRNN